MVFRISHRFENTRFPPQKIREAVNEALRLTAPEKHMLSGTIEIGSRTFELSETSGSSSEFFRLYESGSQVASGRWRFIPSSSGPSGELNFRYHRVSDTYSATSIEVRLGDRDIMDRVLDIFLNYQQSCPDLSLKSIEETNSLKVFIGHGRSNAWQLLKNHLSDQHGYTVIAYETGARAGHHIRDILDEMAEESSIAFLVMTAEDELATGELQARPNVIHETGLFQGRLGFSRAIVLLETGCSEFSNLAGIQQVRFRDIKETFGDVLATIKREFGK